MGKLHPKKRLLQKYSEESRTKQMPRRSLRTNAPRQDLSYLSIQLSDVTSTSKTYNTYYDVPDNEEPREAWPSEVAPREETNYFIPHLPEIIVSTDLTGLQENKSLKRVTHDDGAMMQMGKNLKDSTSNRHETNLSCSPHSQKEVQYTNSKKAKLESRPNRRYLRM